MIAIEKLDCYPQIPRIGSMPYRATWGSTKVIQEAEGMRRNSGQKPLLWFQQENTGLRLVTLSNFIEFWPVEVVLSCLVPGSG